MSAPAPITNLKALAKAAKEAKEAAANASSANSTPKPRDRDLWLFRTLGERIAEQAEFLAVPAAQRGHGWVKCFECHLPGQNKDGQRHAPESTHWSGPGADPSVDGAPMVFLLQGPKLQDRSPPGGKTAVQIAQDILQEKGADITLDCRYNFGTKTIIVTAIWVQEDWDNFLAKREQRRRQFVPRPRYANTNPAVPAAASEDTE
jgi:hypothetical protein